MKKILKLAVGALIVSAIIAQPSQAATWQCRAAGLSVGAVSSNLTVVVSNHKGSATVKLRKRGKQLVGLTPKHKVPVRCTKVG